MLRFPVLLAALVSCVTLALAQVTPDEMEKRIEEQAERLQNMAGGRVARAGFVDFTWPVDPREHRALAKHVLVLVTAVTHEESELPLKRVYVEADGKEIELQRLGGVRSEIRAGSTAAEVLGTHREDAFYLAPAAAMAAKGHLRADFAAHRDGFGLYELPGTPPDFVARDRRPVPRGAKPDPKAVKAMLEREYPGFPEPEGLR